MAQLFVQNAHATLFFAVELRERLTNYPGHPNHPMTFVYVGEVEIGFRGSDGRVHSPTHFALLATPEARAVGRALHMQCVPKASICQRGTWVI